MKKHNRQPVAILTATLLSLLTFAGCSLNPMLIFPEEREAQKRADQLKEDVVEYLNDGDAEALSELFSSEDQEESMLRDYFSRDKDKRIPLLIPATMMKKDDPDGKVVEIMFSDLSEFTFVISDDPVVKRSGFW